MCRTEHLGHVNRARHCDVNYTDHAAVSLHILHRV